MVFVYTNLGGEVCWLIFPLSFVLTSDYLCLGFVETIYRFNYGCRSEALSPGDVWMMSGIGLRMRLASEPSKLKIVLRKF